MKKKILLIAVILCIFTVVQAYSFGIGAQGNFYAQPFVDAEFGATPRTFATGFSVLFSPSRVFHIAGNYLIEPAVNNYETNNTTVSLTLDFAPISWNIARSQMTLLSNPKAWSFNFTAGIGPFFNFWFEEFLNFNDDKSRSVSGGIRVPVGVNFLFAQYFEAFVHVAPSWGFTFTEGVKPGAPFFPVALGGRFWLKGW